MRQTETITFDEVIGIRYLCNRSLDECIKACLAADTGADDGRLASGDAGTLADICNDFEQATSLIELTGAL